MRFGLRSFLFTSIGLAVVLVIAFEVMQVFSFLNTFSTDGFGGGFEFVELSGQDAKARLHAWPSKIDPIDVELVWCKSGSSRDSSSSWTRLKLTKEAAVAWEEDVHIRLSAQTHRGSSDEGFEGVQRTILGPPPQNFQTGTTPEWWNPPAIQFRATEVMVWYEEYFSGVGHAVYTSYNVETKELWIYDYYCQHDLLWEPGMPPDGKIFGRGVKRGRSSITD